MKKHNKTPMTYQKMFDLLLTSARRIHSTQLPSGVEILQFDCVPCAIDQCDIFTVIIDGGEIVIIK